MLILCCACEVRESSEKSGNNVNTVDSNESGKTKADSIVNRALIVHGAQAYDSFAIRFTFRDHTYGIQTNGGKYRYTRTFTDSLGQDIQDVLTNDGLSRLTDGTASRLNAVDSAAYARSVNSVRYFFMLPYGLYDPAVYRSYLGETTIKEEPYHEVRITFDEVGGGRDHDDVFYYFFHREEGTLDYLAYNYIVDGGGVRFREAINRRVVDGLVVQDYVNYGLEGDTAIRQIAERFAAGELKRLSEIVSENITTGLINQAKN